jgi:hypothetical protein
MAILFKQPLIQRDDLAANARTGKFGFGKSSRLRTVPLPEFSIAG